MKTVRRYLASEIYRSTLAVLLVLLGLFMFFDMIESLDTLSDKFPFTALLSMQLMQTPTRLYELLPIGLLIGAIISLASLAQRNELVIFRVSGLSTGKMLILLWLITIPLTIFAFVLSEYVTPYAETKTTEANLKYLDKAGGERLVSGYWFREPTADGDSRVINIKNLSGSDEVQNIYLYTINGKTGQFKNVIYAKSGQFEDDNLHLQEITQNTSQIDFDEILIDAEKPIEKVTHTQQLDKLSIKTSLTQKRLQASQLQPDRMSVKSLLDYVQYLDENNLKADRQIVALWRKLAYPFTLFVMMTLAAPIGFIQTRKGGAGAKIFLGILVGVTFFMINQLSLNIGMLSNLPAWLTALFPNTVAILAAILALFLIEKKNRPRVKS